MSVVLVFINPNMQYELICVWTPREEAAAVKYICFSVSAWLRFNNFGLDKCTLAKLHSSVGKSRLVYVTVINLIMYKVLWVSFCRALVQQLWLGKIQALDKLQGGQQARSEATVQPNTVWQNIFLTHVDSLSSLKIPWIYFHNKCTEKSPGSG